MPKVLRAGLPRLTHLTAVGYNRSGTLCLKNMNDRCSGVPEQLFLRGVISYDCLAYERGNDASAG
jgi:hypothetical protein